MPDHAAKGRYSVVQHFAVAENMMRLTIESEGELPPYLPGQFLHIRVTDGSDHLLRRPISLCTASRIHKQFTVVYRISGKGTKLLADKRVGDTLDVLGPLGKGFPLHKGDRNVLLLGGGIGVPPMVELAKQLTIQGVKVTTIVGFQTASQAILIDDLSQYGEVLVATNDGSLGQKGFVTQYLTEERLAETDRFYACGPSPMLAAVQKATGEKAVGYLSLEERMGCGIGLCAACVHKAVMPDGSVGYRKVCKEGPVFAAEEVVFDV
ncbi:dihydroorotate dehydrogenase electron transfer subunit [Effusibacillus dendaii]|uniref:Dihydroorotate dehydrogenase B (NAD(+)), electron transfer subunit n=1 Tax=Effusibacillus dendaii TaxID=2743772 RepID=A0A7I8D791_9BACL|nr:dihydroorotate dehydrogenase electron transfer subunit [Effusibacillus dendaii]BCJ86038.1 dihydroorotate dehydrogenase B (NAD(+)), electron transfer subunit [Effusibacillus dendaii]